MSSSAGSMKEGRMPSWHFRDGVVEGGFLKAANYSGTRRMEGGSRVTKQANRQMDGQAGRQTDTLSTKLSSCGAFGGRLSPVTLLALISALCL